MKTLKLVNFGLIFGMVMSGHVWAAEVITADSLIGFDGVESICTNDVGKDCEKRLSTIKFPIAVEGNHFVDATGRRVILRGVNMGQQQTKHSRAKGDWEGLNGFPEEFYYDNGAGSTLGEDWAKFLAANGMNVLRLNIAWSQLEPFYCKMDESGNFVTTADGKYLCDLDDDPSTPLVPADSAYDDEFIAKIKDAIHVFGKYGVLTILDSHEDVLGTPYGVPPTSSYKLGWPKWAISNDEVNLVGQYRSVTNYFNNPAMIRAISDFYQDNKIIHNGVADGLGLAHRYGKALRYLASKVVDEPKLLMYGLLNHTYLDTEAVNCIRDNYDITSVFIPFVLPIPYVDEGKDTACMSEFQTRYLSALHIVASELRQADQVHPISFQPGEIFMASGTSETGIALTSADLAAVDSNVLLNNFYFGVDEFYFTAQRSLANKLNIVLFASEWGGSLGNNPGDPNLSNIAALLDQRAESTAFWVLFPTASKVEEIYSPGSSMRMMPNRALRPTEGNLNVCHDNGPCVVGSHEYDFVSTVLRPYPRAIAGHVLKDQGWSFDLDTKVFNFTYSTVDEPVETDAEKEVINVNHLTEIFLPKRHYPNGYNVEVTGGVVVPDVRDEVLLIKRVGNASSITVRVTPK